MLKGVKNSCFEGPFLPTLAMNQSYAEVCNAFKNALVLEHKHLAWANCLLIDVRGLAMVSIKM
jgi:hypothetical protein